MKIALLILLMLTIVVLKRVLRLSILSAPMIMASLWIALITTSLIIFPRFPWQYLGLIWILLSCLFFIGGFYIGEKMPYEKIDKSKKILQQVHTDALIKTTLICIAIGILYPIVKLQSLGFSLSMLFDFNQLAEINNSVAVLRYSGMSSYSLLFQLLLVFVYLSPLLGGYLYGQAIRVRDKYIAVSSFFPVFILLVFTNEKATFIAALIFWSSACLIGYIRKNDKYPIVKKSSVIRLGLILLVILSILVTSMMLRLGKVDSESFYIVISKLKNSYAFSQIPAFDSVFMDINNASLKLGTITFYGISNFLGLSNRLQGIYTDSFNYEELGTNIFTVFRGIILDYGYIGGLVFQTLLGIIAGRSLLRIKHQNKMPSISIVVLIAIYSFITYSFIVSIFSYLSLILSLVIFALILTIMPLNNSTESGPK